MNLSIAPERFYDTDPRNPANQAEPVLTYYINDYPFVSPNGRADGFRLAVDAVADKHVALLDRFYDDRSEWLDVLQKLADESYLPVSGEIYTADADGKPQLRQRTVTINPKESE